jgi:hypothetical protein
VERRVEIRVVVLKVGNRMTDLFLLSVSITIERVSLKHLPL